MPGSGLSGGVSQLNRMGRGFPDPGSSSCQGPDPRKNSGLNGNVGIFVWPAWGPAGGGGWVERMAVDEAEDSAPVRPLQRYLPGTCCVPSSLLEAANTAANQTDAKPCPYRAHLTVKDRSRQNQRDQKQAGKGLLVWALTSGQQLPFECVKQGSAMALLRMGWKGASLEEAKP